MLGDELWRVLLSKTHLLSGEGQGGWHPAFLGPGGTKQRVSVKFSLQNTSVLCSRRIWGFKRQSEDRVMQEQPVGEEAGREILSQLLCLAPLPLFHLSSTFPVNCRDVPHKDDAEVVPVVTQVAAQWLEESSRSQRKRVGFLG